MTTMVISRQTPIDTLFSFIGAERVELLKSNAGVVFAPAVSASEDVVLAAKRARRRAAFDDIQIDLTGFVFNRDEANNYE